VGSEDGTAMDALFVFDGKRGKRALRCDCDGGLRVCDYVAGGVLRA
jgi:hypothetical protein